MSTAKKIAKRNSKPKTTKPVTKPSTAAMAKVHQLFDKDGAEAAWVLGLKLQLKASTLRSWFAAWKRVQSKSKKVETNSSTPPAMKPDGLSATSEAVHP